MVQSEIVERLAEAIYAEASRQGAGHGNFDILYTEVQDGLRLLARAALEAMREPDNVMRLASKRYKRKAKVYSGPECYRQMIDAALQEPSK